MWPNDDPLEYTVDHKEEDIADGLDSLVEPELPYRDALRGQLTNIASTVMTHGETIGQLLRMPQKMGMS